MSKTESEPDGGNGGAAILRRLRRLKKTYSLFRCVVLIAVFSGFTLLAEEMCGLIHLEFPGQILGLALLYLGVIPAPITAAYLLYF